MSVKPGNTPSARQDPESGFPIQLYPKSESFIPRPILVASATPPASVDPVTFELLRHRIALVNEENAATILTLSGSPAILFSRDFNSAVLTSAGEYVSLGRHILTHGGVIDLAVRFLMEAAEAGGLVIDPGDMFLINDPWIAAGHANDVIIVAPVFDGPRLLAWVGNTVHHADVGGRMPGSRDLDARTMYDEGICIPWVKIVRAGRFSTEIAGLVERQSRNPGYVGVDLRAQVAGNRAAAERLEEITGNYGGAALSSVFEMIIGIGDRRCVEVLGSLPDGRWRVKRYIDGARTGDEQFYPVGLELEKSGSELTFRDFESWPEQPAPINSTFSGWRAGVLCGVLGQMGSLSPGVPGGILRHLRFEYSPGTLLMARRPSPVNRATSVGVSMAMGMATELLARLLVWSAELRPEVVSISGHQPIITAGVSGRWPGGSTFTRVFTDTEANGGASTLARDGDGTCGSSLNVGCAIPNVEETELSGGLLYLFRREEQDTGGPGFRRGGNAIAYALTPYRSHEVTVNLSASGVAGPTFPGLFGGAPGRNRGAFIYRAAAPLEMVSGGTAGRDLGGAEPERLLGKCQGIRLDGGDVLLVISGSGTGQGDPLVREVALVADDVAAGRLSPDRAWAEYGVSLHRDGADTVVDMAATQGRREELRSIRLGGRAPAPAVTSSATASAPSPSPWLSLTPDGGLACAACAAVVGEVSYGADGRPSGSARLPGLRANSRPEGRLVVTETFCANCGLRLALDWEAPSPPEPLV
jgi:N-methylhydantoinase B